MNINTFTCIFLGLFFLHRAIELWLEFLQARHLAARKDRVPKHLEGKVDIEIIRKAVSYNREKLHFRVFSRIWDSAILLALVFFGFSFLDRIVGGFSLGPIFSGLVFLFGLGLASFLLGLPEELYFTFVIEQKHGFNRQKYGGFILDKLKGGIISAIIGGVLAGLVLLTFEKAGSLWWVIAFGAVTVVQLFAMWLYPVLIMPIFNKFEPVDSSLSEDVAALAKKVGFPLGQVFSMDGSRRSAHSNAFIVGLFGARRIVLYDTLIDKLSRRGLLAVLAHELGHFRLGHIRNRLVLMVAGMLGLFAAMGWVASNPDVSAGLGFEKASGYGALVASGLLVSEALFPAAWILRLLSRRDEYAADRFAVKAVENGYDLLDALVGLTKQNLSSPGSHRYYRGYYNTHPALRDRLRAIRRCASESGLPTESELGKVDRPMSPEGDRGEDDCHQGSEDDANFTGGNGKGDVELPDEKS